MRSEPQPIMPRLGLFLVIKPPVATQQTQQTQQTQHVQQSVQQGVQSVQHGVHSGVQSDAQQSTGLQQASRYLPFLPICQPLRAASASFCVIPLGNALGTHLPKVHAIDFLALQKMSGYLHNTPKVPAPIAPAADNGDMHIVVLTDVGI